MIPFRTIQNPALLSVFCLLSVWIPARALTIQGGTGARELVRVGDSWDYFKGTEAPSSPDHAWKDPGFVVDPATWNTGRSGFGYGDGDDATLLQDMEDNYSSLFVRKEFTVTGQPAEVALELVIDYDDGFVAWLNGEEVARSSNLPPGDPTFQTTTRTGQNHEAGTPEVINLGLASELLVEGSNVLAVAGFNASLGSSDFSLIPSLRTGEEPGSARNGETLIVVKESLPLSGTVDSNAAAVVRIDTLPVDFDPVTKSWSGEATLIPGRNAVLVEAFDESGNSLESGTLEVVYVPPGGIISGTIEADSTWSGAYLLDGTVEVPAGVGLEIIAGTVVILKPGASMEIRGRLQALGTGEAPITFTHHGDGTTWERLLFIQAENSELRHCIIEYSNCEGDHKDYYDDDCNEETPPPGNRTYFQAVVALGCHLDIESCLFHKLPDDSNSAEGDAIAIISDDPDLPPAVATANIRDCDFIGIGQGVHTRYAPVVVEHCFFTGHNGDNDDVDLYGESNPPPLILHNVMINPGHDDMINPTRCSAIVIGNVIAGSDDHGIVLRDKSKPILINNLIYNCSSAGISVQNQCDALLINNTIVDCGRGVRFFDHTNRWDPPYCLFPGSGKATLINCIIRDCPTPFDLEDSPRPEDRGSHVTVEYCNIENGRTASRISANSTITWGDGNVDLDPLFADPVQNDFRLRAGSPLIDTGTLVSALVPDLSDLLPDDFDGIPRPLDGDGDGRPGIDLGAFEFLLASADSNADEVPDGWSHRQGINPTVPNAASGNPDGDPYTTGEEYLADTDPLDAQSFLRLGRISLNPTPAIEFPSSADRVYTLLRSTNLMDWTAVPGQIGVPGSGSTDTLRDNQPGDSFFYRIEASLP